MFFFFFYEKKVGKIKLISLAKASFKASGKVYNL